MESYLDSGVDSALDSNHSKDSRDSTDSKRSLESNINNPHKAKRSATFKSVVGGGKK